MDSSFVAEFIDESIESISTVADLFIQLEARPDDKDVIQAIFRPVHSIKGNSAIFGFKAVKDLAHEMETNLDRMRKDLMPVTRDAIDRLLEGADALAAMLQRARAGEGLVADEKAFDALLMRIRQSGMPEAGAGAGGVSPDVAAVAEELDQLASAFADDADTAGILGGLAARLRAGVVSAGGETGDAPAAPRPLREPTPAEAALRAFLEEAPESDTGEGCRRARECVEAIAAEDAAGKAPILDAMREDIGTFEDTLGYDELLQQSLRDKLDELLTMAPYAEPAASADAETPPDAASAGAEAPPEPRAAAGDAPAPKAAPAQEAAKTMRVTEAQIDTFLEHVGELVVVGDMFRHTQQQLQGLLTADQLASFRQTLETFLALSTRLQKSIMAVRKVPVQGMLQRVPRIVRDVAAQSGKDVAAEIHGGEVLVDKSLLDLFDAPLVHMVRNAADHGIEPPDERAAAGKAARGSIVVSVREEDSHIICDIRDDGAGLNLDKLRDKAIGLGLMQPGQQLRSEDIVRLICSSGVSTAREVTDISGRGVGMDVVRRRIDEAGGRIEVVTRPGEGTTFTLRVPASVTTQITDGLAVRLDEQVYMFPLARVVQAVSPEEGAVQRAAGGAQLLVQQEGTLPIIDLRQRLGLRAARDTGDSGPPVLVVVEAFGRRTALTVDEVVGVLQVVLRPLGGLDAQAAGITAAATMGDGTLAMIIDPERLLDRRKPGARGRDGKNGSAAGSPQRPREEASVQG